MAISVVLHAVGNSQIGVGHLSRTATLAAALHRSNGWHRVVLLWETSPELSRYFAPPGCEVIAVETAQKALDQRSRIVQTADCWILITDLLHLQPQDILASRQQGFQTIVHINDSGSGRWLADMVVDEDAFKTVVDLPLTFRGIGLVGNPYRIICESVTQKRPCYPWQSNLVRRMLVTFGGADPANLTIQLIEKFCAEQPPYLEVMAIIGPAFQQTQISQLIALAQTQSGLQVIECPDCISSLILAHDLIVTLGGITTYEAFCLGKPCAAVAWSYMSTYVTALSQQGLLANLGTIEQASAHLAALIQKPIWLAKLAQTGWECVDGQGANRVATEILKLMQTMF